jgi:rhamnulokinase
MNSKRVIAVDIGAESGRVMQVGYDGQELHLDEVHRFPNIATAAAGTLYWNPLLFFNEILNGIRAARAGAVSMGVNTWGVDFALLDRDGRMIANPIHYRDTSWVGMEEWVCERISRREIYERTGIQFMPPNTIWRLAYLAKTKSPILDIAETYLTIADLLNYWLCGSKTCEFTHVTTHQIYNPRLGDWDRDLLARIGLPTEIFGEIVQPGTKLGYYNDIPVIAPAMHDTASAVAAVPTTTQDYAYISSGTWSLLGLEVNEPIINDAAYEANATNEGGVNHTFRFLKNIAGMWLVQQARATWAEQGQQYDYAELATMAEKAMPFTAFIDPDDDEFFMPGDIPARIHQFCQRTGQTPPESVAQITRVIYDSLAFKYRYVLEKLLGAAGRKAETVHIIGGGSKNAVLCQMAADATGRRVVAGPSEATALGNAIVQFVTLGEFKDVAEARQLLSRGAGMITYEPRNTSAWNAAYERFVNVLTTR